MGRSIPSPEAAGGISHLSQHILGLALFAAIVAVVGVLCGTRHHRRSSSSSPPPPPPQQPPAAKPGSRRRGLSMSLSMNVPDGLAKISTSRRGEKKKKAGSGEGEKEESLWMKAIILGDKCKVPEEDEEEEDSFVAYDSKGNRQKSYRPRTPRSLPISRAASFSDRDGGAAVVVAAAAAAAPAASVPSF